MKNEDKSFAMIYPVPKNLIDRILIDKKPVFVKFVSYEKIHASIASSKKIVFYVSRSNKEIVGEAQILSVELMNKEEVVSKYTEELFITREELEKYTKERINKKMLVFKLGEIVKYSQPKYVNYPITMVGINLSKDRYDHLVSSGN